MAALSIKQEAMVALFQRHVKAKLAGDHGQVVAEPAIPLMKSCRRITCPLGSGLRQPK